MSSRPQAALPIGGLLVTFLAAANAAAAAEPFEVPGGDLFGFTSASDVGDVGGKGLAFETTTRNGKGGGGAFMVPTFKAQMSWTPVEDTQIAASPFFTGFRADKLPGVDDKSFVGFDGFSVEASRRIVTRSAANPTAVTVSAEARWGRVDGATGRATDARSITFKLFADRAIVPETLYAGINVALTTGTAQLRSDTREARTETSGSDVSGAVTYQVSERFFVGGEAHWLEAFTGNAGEHWQGRAFTAGPTAFFKISDSMTVNAGWQAQVSGSKTGESRPLNLSDFDRHQVRLKLALGF